MNNAEERELLRNLLNRVDAGESVVKIDDTSLYDNRKTDSKKYVMRRLKLNHDVNDICAGVISNYSITEDEAIKLIKSCRNYLNKQYKEYAQEVALHNIEMLQQIIEDSLEVNDRKTAIQAITELDRITGLHSENNVIINQTNISSNQPIEIVFK